MNKQAKTTLYVGSFLIMVILSTSVYIMLPDSVRIDITNTRSQFSVWENNEWTLAATQYLNLFDGTTKMRAKSRLIEKEVIGNYIKIVRTSEWKDNIFTYETYLFDGNTQDITKFPITYVADCSNCQGKIVHFEIRDILYFGENSEIISPFSFGHNMKIEWEEGNYYSKVFQQKVASDKIIIKYRPKTNYESYQVRLYDPPVRTKPVYLYKTKLIKDNLYKNIQKEIACNNQNGTCLNCNNLSLGNYCKLISQQTFNRIDYNLKVLPGREGVAYQSKERLGKQRHNIINETVYEWTFNQGQRNWNEFGICSIHEIEKKTCKII